MKKKLSCFWFVVFSWMLLFSGALYAQSAASELQNKLTHFQNMTADFQQTVMDADGLVLQHSFGKMAIVKPGKFRWDVTKPLKQLIVTDGAKVWIYEPDLEQVVIRKLNQSVGQTPALLLLNPNKYLLTSFTIQKITTDAKKESRVRASTYRTDFKLTPKNKEETFGSVILSFDGDKLSQMQLQNQLGQKTVLIFKNIKINREVSIEIPTSFPKGTDVINY
jgi:outer membrane lipoprotein carrier protein